MSLWSRFVGLFRPKGPSAYFAGARIDRTVEDFWSQTISANRAIKADHRLLVDRSRQLCADNAHVAGYLTALEDNVIGWEPDGIRVQAQIRSTGGDLLRNYNKRAEDAFREWCEADTCSANGRLSFGDIQRGAIRSEARDGEYLIRELIGFPNRFGYALQVIDPDLLNRTKDRAGTDTLNEIVMGVERDRYGRPVNYHLWSHHPTDAGRKRTEVVVPAEEMIHGFVDILPGQARGLPWLTPVLLTMKMFDGFSEAHLMQARAAAAVGGFFTRTGEDAASYVPVNATGTADDPATQPGRQVMPIEPGVIREAPLGTHFETWNPNAPNSSFPEFQTAMLRTIARGLNVGYTTFSGDGREMNYGTLRGMSIQERDGWKCIQRREGARLVSRVYRNWLACASLAGMVRLPTEAVSQHTPHKLQFRGWQWVDPRNDVETAALEVAMGINSLTSIAAERGRDLEQVFEERAEEIALAEDYGVPLGDVMAQTGANDPNAPTAQPEEDPKNPSTESKRPRSEYRHRLAARQAEASARLLAAKQVADAKQFDALAASVADKVMAQVMPHLLSRPEPVIPPAPNITVEAPITHVHPPEVHVEVVRKPTGTRVLRDKDDLVIGSELLYDGATP